MSHHINFTNCLATGVAILGMRLAGRADNLGTAALFAAGTVGVTLTMIKMRQYANRAMEFVKDVNCTLDHFYLARNEFSAIMGAIPNARRDWVEFSLPLSNAPAALIPKGPGLAIKELIWGEMVKFARRKTVYALRSIREGRLLGILGIAHFPFVKPLEPLVALTEQPVCLAVSRFQRTKDCAKLNQINVRDVAPPEGIPGIDQTGQITSSWESNAPGQKDGEYLERLVSYDQRVIQHRVADIEAEPIVWRARFVSAERIGAKVVQYEEMYLACLLRFFHPRTSNPANEQLVEHMNSLHKINIPYQIGPQLMDGTIDMYRFVSSIMRAQPDFWERLG